MDEIIDFTLSYNRYKKKLYNFTLRMTGDRMMAEDIVQTVFLRFFKHMHEIRNSSAVIFWLYKAARNEIYSQFRNRKRYNERTEATDVGDLQIPGGTDGETGFILNETREMVLDAIATLPDEQKEVVLLKEYSGLSYDEIASICGIETALVKSRLYSARQKLIKILSKKINE